MAATTEIKIADNNNNNLNLKIHNQDNLYDSVTGCVLTGSWFWDSALILSKHISTHIDFRNKSVLELGAGAGLPGLTAATLGANRVVLTDVKPLLPGLINNVEANGLGDRVEVMELVWGSYESSSDELGEFQLVLMSDVFYDVEEMVGLGKTLKRACGRCTEVWAATEVRPWTCECLNELVSQGFGIVELQSNGGGCEGDESRDEFVVFQIIPPFEENC